MIYRALNLPEKHSFFLFGPRGSGKTTLLNSRFSFDSTFFVNLLDPDTEDRYTTHPADFERDLLTRTSPTSTVIIDEIQKAPRLLDVVQKLMGTHSYQFILTGSSARKLRRGAANMLAGRAFVYHLHPFTFFELGKQFELDAALQWGTLPAILGLETDSLRTDFLRAYTQTYLKEEILVEQLVRKLPPFRRFLEVAAQSNGKIINYSKIAEDIQVETPTVQSYFSILEDTLVGFLLPAYHTSVRKQQRSNPKFYFFDTGVRRALERTLGTGLVRGTYAYGDAFEHFVMLEFFRLCQYWKPDWKLSYLRTNHGAEIDLIIDRPGQPTALVEIKSTERITERDVSTLNRFAADMPWTQSFCLSCDPHQIKLGQTLCLPWYDGFTAIELVA